MQGLTLAMDGSVKNVSVALFVEQQMLATCQEDSCDPSSLLISSLDSILKRGGVQLGDIKSLVFCHGPGSFTSLRVGLATLLGLFLGRPINYYQASSHLFRCLSLKKMRERNQKIVSLIKMGRDRLSSGTLSKNHFEEKLCLREDFLIHLKQAAPFTGSENGVTVIGDGVSLFSDAELEGRCHAVRRDVTDPQAFLDPLFQKHLNSCELQSAFLHYGLEPDIG